MALSRLRVRMSQEGERTFWRSMMLKLKVAHEQADVARIGYAS